MRMSICICAPILFAALLATHGAPIDPLIEAIESSNEERVRELLAGGASVRSRDDAGNTPLHYIARRCNGDLVELLITKGADPNARNDRKRTPLHWAADQCDFELVERMIWKGGDYRALDINGESPLYVSATRFDPYFVFRFVHETETDISGDAKLSAFYGSLVADRRAQAVKMQALFIGIPLLLLLTAVLFREVRADTPRVRNVMVHVSAVGFVSGLGFLGGFFVGALFISRFFFTRGGDGWGAGIANPVIALFVGIVTAVVCAIAGIPVAIRHRERFGTSRILYYTAPLLFCAAGLFMASRVSMEPFIFP